METIRSVYLKAAEEVEFKVDRSLIERLAKYERDFVNRDEEHINFFGSNLVGVYQMKFRQQDRDNWFLDIVNLDELDLADALKKVSYLDPKWKRPNDPMNLSCIWLMHEIVNSKNLTAGEKQRGLELVALILQYKFMGSILSHYFKFVADKAAMEAAMAALSRKYAIKVAGTWGRLFHQRAEEIASTRSIHYRAYSQFNSDKDITYMVNDIQSRLKELIKNIWAVFARIKEAGTRITVEKSITSYNGEDILKEKSRRFTSYLRYIHDVLPDKRSFIRDELVSVITDLMHTVPPKHLQEALEWMSLNHRVKGEERVEVLIDETLLHCFSMIVSNRTLYGHGSSLEALLGKLRALYTASRMSDTHLLKMKDLADEIVSRSVTSKNVSVQAGVRTSIQLYIVLRTLAMQHYQQ
mgnify:CR=1 FL=1